MMMRCDDEERFQNALLSVLLCAVVVAAQQDLSFNKRQPSTLSSEFCFNKGSEHARPNTSRISVRVFDNWEFVCPSSCKKVQDHVAEKNDKDDT